MPQDARRDPNNVADMRAMMMDPNARVFALFLDLTHVSLAGSHEIRKPLTNLLDRAIGPDDLVGVMTPAMSALDVTFSRKTRLDRDLPDKALGLGRRQRARCSPIRSRQLYQMCYPGIARAVHRPDAARSSPASDVGVADEMIARRREVMVFDSLEDLIRYLGGVREERIGGPAHQSRMEPVQPDSNLARPLHCDASARNAADRRRSERRKAHDAAADGNDAGDGNRDQCERDRLNLAQINDVQHFRRLPDQANRANVSFYPIDSGGLGAPTTVGGIDRLKDRLDTLRVLADTTDGLAVVNTNDIDAGVKRVAADLSSYYLLGYYSTNLKLDGKFHAIKVRVKRAGVQVRARRGYLAPTASRRSRPDVGKGVRPSGGGGRRRGDRRRAHAARRLHARREPSLRLQLAAGWTPAHAGVIWAVGELGSERRGDDRRRRRRDAHERSPGVTHRHRQRAHGAARAGFRVALAPTVPMPPGEYIVRVRARRDASPDPPVNEVGRVTFPLEPDTAGAMLIRRGQVTGNKEVPTADRRFRRGETDARRSADRDD